MSPLARSLLALAATLAIASAVPQRRWFDGACSILDIGERGDPAQDVPLGPMTLDCPIQQIEVPDYCASGYHLCGEHIEACNTDSDGPAPSIDPNGKLSPLTVTCNDPNEKKMTVTIIEHCCRNPIRY